jgi:phenylalanyl-tRNA synthetase beta chain
VPGYRVDIDREVDLIEEVARVQGYDRIGSSVPSAGQAGGEPPRTAFRRRVRDAFVRAGLREVRLLSFASQEDLALTGERDAIEIANPLQTDERFLRTRLLPGLLHTAARNQARGSETVAIFETSTVFRAQDPVEELEQVAFVLTGPVGEGWAADDRVYDVLDVTGVLEAVCAELGVVGLSLGEPPGDPFHPARAATIEVDGRPIGVAGELHPRVAEALELTGRVALAELNVEALRLTAGMDFVVDDVPRFPPVRRDLAFVVPHDAPAGSVQEALQDAAGEMLARCVLFDVFEGGTLPAGTKSLAFSLEFRAPDRTLTGEETDPLVQAVRNRLAERFGAELRAG